mmetsp:Transcript_516/g.721  ORF Transcript_516/g.721 Transcript_516/m.721 type:complete len:326 (+) Transcript_516:97-1074(+)
MIRFLVILVCVCAFASRSICNALLTNFHRPRSILKSASSSFEELSDQQQYDFYFGTTFQQYQEYITQEHIDSLFWKGYVILDDVFSLVERENIAKAFDEMEGVNFLQDENEPYRDDAIQFVDEKRALPAIRMVICRLKGLASTLQPHYAAARNDPAQHWWEKSGDLYTPATEDQPLTADTGAQLASFAPGGRYTIHSDNSQNWSGERRNFRAITCIAYANPLDWSEEKDGGHLNIWPGTDYTELHDFDTRSDEGRAKIKEFLKTAPRVGNAGHETENREDENCISVAPMPGRVVLFRSTMLHEVAPSKRRRRRAVTQWFQCPQKK